MPAPAETRKGRADSGVVAFLSAAEALGLFLSVLTLGELRKGIAARRRSDPRAADLLGAWVDDIETSFADRVLPVDAATARRWGELSANRNLPVIDSLIAATAISHGLTLVARNARDIDSSGIKRSPPPVVKRRSPPRPTSPPPPPPPRSARWPGRAAARRSG